MSLSHSWGASKLLQNCWPHSHPQHTCFLAPPDAALVGAKNQPKQPELLCERPALCPWGSGEGACRLPLSMPNPQREGSASHDWLRPYQPCRGGRDRDWLSGEWVAALGGGVEAVGSIFPGLDPMAPKLWPSSSPAVQVLQRGGDGIAQPSPAARSWTDEIPGCSIILKQAPGQWTSPTCFSAPELCGCPPELIFTLKTVPGKRNICNLSPWGL